MSIRLIALDIDGTLLNSRGEIPEANRQAIEAAVAAGVEVVLATGRSYQFTRPIADELPDDVTLLVSNGALVKTNGVTRLRRLLPRSVAKDVLASVPDFRCDAALIFDTSDEAYIVHEQIDWELPFRRKYFQRNSAAIAKAVPLEDALVDDPIQIMFNGRVAAMRQLLAELRTMPCAARVEVALTEYAHRDFSMVDVLAEGCSKGSALQAWADRRGVRREHVMAIGDNFNDVQMLEFAGLPVLMGNAADELKTRGWTVTATHDEAGVARAMDQFLS